jgi:hypothetical protein
MAKIRQGFVSNSSSTAFIIINKSDKPKTIVNFVEENPQIIEEYKEDFNWYANDPKYTQENLIESAKEENIDFDPKEEKICVFGDEHHNLINCVFDYALRYGGESENFIWKFHEYWR